MKACPTCERTYADDSLTYCLVDGAILSAPYDPNATLHMPDVRTTDGKASQPPPQTTIVALQPPKLYSDKQQISSGQKQTSKALLAIAISIIALAFVVVGAAVFILVRLSNKTEPSPARPSGSIATASPTVGSTPVASPSESIAVTTPTATPEIEEAERWERHENTSINEGDRITYYPVPSQQRCEDDCERNARCKAYTVIKAGAYNPSDPQMCYLMAAVKTLNPSSCCFSALKR